MEWAIVFRHGRRHLASGDRTGCGVPRNGPPSPVHRREDFARVATAGENFVFLDGLDENFVHVATAGENLVHVATTGENFVAGAAVAESIGESLGDYGDHGDDEFDAVADYYEALGYA